MMSDKVPPLTPRKNKLRMHLLLMVIIFCLLFTPGCWNYKEINDTAVALGMIFDLEEDQPSFSVQLAEAVKSGESGPAAQKAVNITTTGQTYSEAARKTTLFLSRLPGWAHASVIVLGNNLVSQDLTRAADFLARNRNVRRSAMVFVFGGTNRKDCLEAKVPLESYSLPALRKIIINQENQLGIYVPITLDDFLNKLVTPGIEPVVPRVMVRVENDKKILGLDGTAVFKGRRMVGLLNETESRGYRFLSPKMVTGGLITIKSPLDNDSSGKGRISLELTRSQAMVKPVINGSKIKMNIEITAEGNFYEQNFLGELFTVEMINKIETMANQEITREIIACIDKAQSLDSDIFGWGQVIHHNQPAVWEQLKSDWNEVFPTIDTDIKVKFEIRRSYILDKSFDFK